MCDFWWTDHQQLDSFLWLSEPQTIFSCVKCKTKLTLFLHIFSTSTVARGHMGGAKCLFWGLNLQYDVAYFIAYTVTNIKASSIGWAALQSRFTLTDHHGQKRDNIWLLMRPWRVNVSGLILPIHQVFSHFQYDQNVNVRKEPLGPANVSWLHISVENEIVRKSVMSNS